MATVMVVDDDPYIRELVAKLLKNELFEVVEAQNGQEALDRLAKSKVDLVILDLMMPLMDGYEFCNIARKYYSNLPILMLTAKNDINDKVKGFTVGADDYLSKPFEGIELIMRVKALVRRFNIHASKKVEIGILTLDKTSYQVAWENQLQDIPMKEFELLFMLGSQPGKSFSREQLIEIIWGYDFDGNERTLDVHINRLRERFPSEQFQFQIVTIRGLGYRLEVLA